MVSVADEVHLEKVGTQGDQSSDSTSLVQQMQTRRDSFDPDKMKIQQNLAALAKSAKAGLKSAGKVSNTGGDSGSEDPADSVAQARIDAAKINRDAAKAYVPKPFIAPKKSVTKRNTYSVPDSAKPKPRQPRATPVATFDPELCMADGFKPSGTTCRNCNTVKDEGRDQCCDQCCGDLFKGQGKEQCLQKSVVAKCNKGTGFKYECRYGTDPEAPTLCDECKGGGPFDCIDLWEGSQYTCGRVGDIAGVWRFLREEEVALKKTVAAKQEDASEDAKGGRVVDVDEDATKSKTVLDKLAAKAAEIREASAKRGRDVVDVDNSASENLADDECDQCFNTDKLDDAIAVCCSSRVVPCDKGGFSATGGFTACQDTAKTKWTDAQNAQNGIFVENVDETN